jgi:CRP-like cAMP-binding protein
MPSLKYQRDQAENCILAAVPQNRYKALFSRLRLVSLPAGHVVYEQGRPIRFVHFPITARLSVLSVGEGGRRVVEVCAVGREGLAGVPLFLGDDLAPNRAIVQLAGTVMRVEAQIFKDALIRRGLLNRLLERYTLVVLTSVSRAAFCTSFHKVEARLARLLLLMHDSARANTFPLTQEFAAYLLGLHRPGVSIAANALQEARLIRYSHGKITVINREGLDAAACECYRIIKSAYSRLLGDLLTLEA